MYNSMLHIQRLRTVLVNGTGILQVLYRYFDIVIGLVSILVFT